MSSSTCPLLGKLMKMGMEKPQTTGPNGHCSTPLGSCCCFYSHSSHYPTCSTHKCVCVSSSPVRFKFGENIILAVFFCVVCFSRRSHEPNSIALAGDFHQFSLSMRAFIVRVIDECLCVWGSCDVHKKQSNGNKNKVGEVARVWPTLGGNRTGKNTMRAMKVIETAPKYTLAHAQTHTHTHP